mgnify:CR=1 FL=1
MLAQKTLSQPFLVDGIGAIITALMLGVILPHFQPTFGMPRDIMHFLSGIASAFALGSLIFHFFVKKNQGPLLRIVALCNTIYCMITLGLLINYREVVTGWGFAYFLGEIGVVLVLVRLEWNTARKLIATANTSISHSVKHT